MAAPKRMAMLMLSPELLRELLQLPDSVEIVNVDCGAGCRGVVRVMISGAGWATLEGAPIMAVRGSSIADSADKPVPRVGAINWDLEKHPSGAYALDEPPSYP